MGTSLTGDKSIKPNEPPVEVAVGVHVEVELVSESGAREQLAFDIVPDSEADFSSGCLGVGTPLAQAISGQTAGSVVPYSLGDIIEVRIVTVGMSGHSPNKNVAGDRQAVIQKAISKSDLADAVRFALTVDQKWGDTDPEGIASNWEETGDSSA